MSKSVHIDAPSGVAGDMLLAALLDLGADLKALNQGLQTILGKSLRVEVKPVVKAGLSAKHLKIHHDEPQDLRHWRSIRGLIHESSLPQAVRTRSLAILQGLASAEAKIHAIDVDQVHFHEIGAVDTLVDVVGCVLLLEALSISKVSCGPINVGGGIVSIAHGKVPVPAPATLELAEGVPIYGEADAGELTTPTGMALVRGLCDSFGPMPPSIPEAIGYGAGTKDRSSPNVVRLTLSDRSIPGVDEDQVVEVEANIDDTTPEVMATLPQQLMDSGALDVQLISTLMKKGRPGWLVRALATPEKTPEVVASLFGCTTTFGVRTHTKQRYKLKRRSEKVQLSVGEVSVKMGALHNTIITASPEFEDCLALAHRTKTPVQNIMEEARALAKRFLGSNF